MKVIIDLCVVPLGVGLSVSKYVAACESVIKKAGLKSMLHTYGTNIEGDWDDSYRQCQIGSGLIVHLSPHNSDS